MRDSETPFELMAEARLRPRPAQQLWLVGLGAVVGALATSLVMPRASVVALAAEDDVSRYRLKI